jgi:hypothetical protein
MCLVLGIPERPQQTIESNDASAILGWAGAAPPVHAEYDMLGSACRHLSRTTACLQRSPKSYTCRRPLRECGETLDGVALCFR